MISGSILFLMGLFCIVIGTYLFFNSTRWDTNNPTVYNPFGRMANNTPPIVDQGKMNRAGFLLNLG